MTISKRRFLLGAATLSAAWVGWGAMPAWGFAAGTESNASFMQLSRLLVNHQLDDAVGARIAQTAPLLHPRWSEMTRAIIAIAIGRQAQAVEDFFEAIPEGPLRDYAHWVIFAWYSGCASPKKDAQVFTYEQALTYRVTGDAVAIPSYGFSGPNLWHRPITPLSPMPVF